MALRRSSTTRGVLGSGGGFGVAPGARERVYELSIAHLARQGADVAVFKRPLGPEGDLDRLFAVGCHGGATLSNFCEVDDPEIYLRFDPSRAGSQSVTDGEPCRTRTTRVSHLCPKSWEAVQNLPKPTGCIMLARL
jgi:hypothetical protein